MLKGKSVLTKTIRLQTENYKDVYKTDWAQSRIFLQALRLEADKRGIKTHNMDTSDEGNTDDCMSVSRNTYTPKQRTPIKEIEPVQMQNAQDPDTTDLDNETSKYINTAIGFFKNF